MTATSRSNNPFDLDRSELDSMEEILDSFNGQSDIDFGGIIDARVIDSDERDVFFDLGGKEDGRCSRQEFSEEPSYGDVIPVVVISKQSDGMIRLSRLEAERRRAWGYIVEAAQQDTTMSGTVAKQLKQGYIVDAGGLQLFMPLSQSNLRTNLRQRHEIGKALDFKIIELKERHRSAVVSHRRIIEERNDENWEELVSKHKEGEETEGEVVKKVSFGLFVNVCGVEGLLHQNDISWKKFAPFKNRFKIGDWIPVMILSMDRENNRLSLGLKQLTEDPWIWARRELAAGDIIRGKVVSVTDYGVFVELLEGLEGLVHVSELSWSRRPGHPKNHVEVGQDVEAQVLEIEFDRRRISLGFRQLQDDPWSVLGKEIKVGDVCSGKVTAVTKFGAFVEIKENIEGLIHFNDYTWDDKVDRKMLSKGDQVEFKILDINNDDRRVACGIKQLKPSPYEEFARKHKKGAVLDGKITRIAPFGLFVDIGEGFDGLVHVSRLPKLKEGQKLEDVYRVGQEVKSVLQSVDVDQKRIALSIKAYVQKQERAVIEQYIKRDDSPSTSSLASFLKK